MVLRTLSPPAHFPFLTKIVLDSLNFSLRADSVVAFQSHFENLLICCLPPQDLRKRRVLYGRSHYSYIFFFHFPEQVTPQTIFLTEMCKYLPILHPHLLHHSFPLSSFAAIKLSSRFSSSQTLTPGSVLSLLTDVHIYAGNCYFPPVHQSMGCPGCSCSASHLLSSCNPNTLFQLIISPTISFALASTFLSLIFQA